MNGSTHCFVLLSCHCSIAMDRQRTEEQLERGLTEQQVIELKAAADEQRLASFTEGLRSRYAAVHLMTALCSHYANVIN
jgi:uncharacterized membrane protein